MKAYNENKIIQKLIKVIKNTIFFMAFFVIFGIIVWHLLTRDWFGAFITIPRDMKVHEPSSVLPPPFRPDIFVKPGIQSGIYEVFGYVNPGKEGKLFLKIFEATSSLPLSQDEVFNDSLHESEWSQNPEELFVYKTTVKINEGDWGVYYPARFELWFEATAGEKYMIIEKIYKIEGWQR